MSSKELQMKERDNQRLKNKENKKKKRDILKKKKNTLQMLENRWKIENSTELNQSKRRDMKKIQ